MDLNSLTEGVKGLLFGNQQTQNETNQTTQEKQEDKSTTSVSTSDNKKEGTPGDNNEESNDKRRGGRRNPQPRGKKNDPTSPSGKVNQNEQKSDTSSNVKSGTDSVPLSEGQSNTANPEASNTRKLLMTQLEYYFSDENLQRDKFLQTEAEKDETGQGYISLDVLSTFQRVKRFSNNIEDIRAAIRESTIIQLNKGGDKVKRIIPFAFPLSEEQRERRTIYVRYLPKLSNQDSVRGIFGICGSMKRVDIPSDKKSGEIKGIAFIEFESRKQARKAIAYFSDRNNDFFKLGMRVSQYTNRSGSQVTSPEQASPVTSPQHRYLQHQYQNVNFSPEQMSHIPQDQQQNDQPISPRSNNNQQQQQQAHYGNREDSSHGNPNATSIYDGAPTFNYSKQDNKQRKRRGSTETSHTNATASSAERPRLQLRPRSVSDNPRHSGITPLRQPKGPDGTKGFPVGRGKPLP